VYYKRKELTGKYIEVKNEKEAFKN